MTNTRIYLIGISWFILSLVSSAVNDIIVKYTGGSLGSMQITFLRCFFSFVTLVPFILFYGVHTIKTHHPFIQIFRGVLLFFGMASWIFGLKIVPVSTATAISFSIPLFVLVFAYFLLDEKIIWQRWLATIVGFLGMIITLHVYSSDFDYNALICNHSLCLIRYNKQKICYQGIYALHVILFSINHHTTLTTSSTC
jgi:S-adenosylmethionine uptake transporter